jgi:hypothetical protein
VIAISGSIELNIYCDEIKEETIKHTFEDNEKWIYIGILIVPVDKEEKLIRTLLNRRCGNPEDREWGKCETKCSHHEKNDKEVHYTELRSKDKYFIAERWLDFFMTDYELTWFYILGINLTNLNYEFFGTVGGSERFLRIYNRFFRMAIQKSVKSYFSGYSTIIINNLVHDKSDLEHTELFPWHCIYRLQNEDEKIRFNKDSIEFLDSDHRKSLDDRSNLIQYIDLLMGVIVNCFHYSASDKNKISLSLKVLPLVERLIDKPGNINSRYRYVNRLCIDFFPRYKLNTVDEFERNFQRMNSFYKKREIRINRLHQYALPIFE